MSQKLFKGLWVISFSAFLSVFSSGLYAQDIERADAIEYDLFDRMRSGRVFHDRSYPNPDDQYYCPKCNQYHQYSDNSRRGRRRAR